jgi:membrane associated rhomboid family serine protease
MCKWPRFLFLLLLLLIGISFLILTTNQSQIFAAEPNTNVSLDWSEIVKIVGLAGIISGSLSAFLTHHFSIKKIEKEMQIKGK